MTKQILAVQKPTASLNGISQQKFTVVFRTPDDLVNQLCEWFTPYLSTPEEPIVQYRNITDVIKNVQLRG